ncbi:MAG: hypothetical protein LBU85_06285 [Treponema sp.]|jgi:hypothetical protein|nr:hypothetical protein [Treponema sp.]
MKKFGFISAILAVILALVFALASCPSPGGGESGGGGTGGNGGGANGGFSILISTDIDNAHELVFESTSSAGRAAAPTVERAYEQNQKCKRIQPFK